MVGNANMCKADRCRMGGVFGYCAVCVVAAYSVAVYV